MDSAPTNPPALADRLAGHRVFGQFGLAARQALAARLQCSRAERGAVLLEAGRLSEALVWVLSGEVELADPDLGLAVRLGPDALFGAGATPPRQLRAWQASAVTACELAFLPPQALREACDSQRALLYFFPSLQAQAPSGLAAPSADLGALDVPIGELLSREPVVLSPQATLAEVAAVMARQNISSVLLAEAGVLVGIVTDRDLRNRALAPGLPLTRPAGEIATLAPVTLAAHRPAFEAQLLMARHGIHHVPVLEDGRIAGMVTATDLDGHGTSAVSLVSAVYRARDVHELAQATAGVKQLQRNLAAAHASAHGTGRIVTAVTDAVTRRLLQLAIDRLGPAPIPYAWVAAGSQGRSEQAAQTDQDNCLVLDDSYDEDRHGAWFEALALFVCDGLDACGYVHCPGGIMAKNPQWRLPRQRWLALFRQWIEEPEPMALMLTSVFFDLRAIHGEEALLDTLRAEVLRRTRGGSLFLAHLTGNALKHRPPLGLFGQIQLERGGDHPGTLDLKHAGIVPIVDLARVYALAGGIAAVNTQERLALAPAGGEVSPQAAHDLRDALEFIARLRLAHQGRQVQAGQAPDNFLPLEEISNLERSQLKDAFAVVRTLQAVLAQRY